MSDWTQERIDEIRAMLADLPVRYPDTETERRNHMGMLEQDLADALDEIERLREEVGILVRDRARARARARALGDLPDDEEE